MLRLPDGMKLYHGSYCEVRNPDLAKCASFKDFGKGFYLTSSKEQAKSFINISLKKAKANGIIDAKQDYGILSIFEYHHNDALEQCLFDSADSKWLHCVVGHRKKNTFRELVVSMRKYDVVAGKIADDATNFTIMTYLAGAYGMVGSEEADSLCISRLIPERLQDQYCFRTDEALRCLSFVESERVWKN